MARYFDVHPHDPQPRAIAQAVAILREGGLIAYPTDSGYAVGGQIGDQRVKDRIRDLRRLDDRHHYTIMCRDFAQLAQFVHLDNWVFRLVKASTPGPYTFILPATKDVPKRLLHARKKTVERQQSALEDRLTLVEARLRKQYTTLDSNLSKMGSSSSYLANFFG